MRHGRTLGADAFAPALMLPMAGRAFDLDQIGTHDELPGDVGFGQRSCPLLGTLFRRVFTRRERAQPGDLLNVVVGGVEAMLAGPAEERDSGRRLREAYEKTKMDKPMSDSTLEDISARLDRLTKTIEELKGLRRVV